MMIQDPKLRLDAVSRFEDEQRRSAETFRFVVSMFVGLFVFTVLTVWWNGR